MKYFLLFIISISLFISSCSTDFEVNANWKDITVVYGLLNSNDSNHYIKVGKSFLGPQDAYTMAQNIDSIAYKDAIVTLDEYKNGTKTNTFTLEKTTEIIKDSGFFAYSNNVLYKLNEKLSPIAEYKLSVYIPDINKTIKSSTSLINGLDLDGIPPVISLSNYENPFEIKWYSTKNARIYELKLRFHYKEINTLTSDTSFHFIDWSLPNKVSNTISGNEKMSLIFSSESFFKFLASKIPVKTDIKRIVLKNCIDLRFLLGGDDLYTYIEVTKPSNGLVQEKPTFSNIENGIGIFSSTYDKNILGKQLSDKTVDSIAKGIHTKQLKFLDHNAFEYANQ